MLVLSRRPTEQVRIGQEIMLTVVSIDGNKVRLGLDAPREIVIVRNELVVPETKLTLPRV